MNPPLRLALVTLGEPTRLTGGYLYHVRLAELAGRHGARVDFVSFPEWPFPWPLLQGGRVLAEVRQKGAQAILLDSIAAAYLAPWLWTSRLGIPVLGILHQGPGGIGQSWLRTHLQAPLDRLAYARACCLMVASQSLRDELVSAGFDACRLEVAAPGRDVAELPTGRNSNPLDLRQGRLAALLCVANWARMKDIVSLLEAFAGLPSQLATLHLAGDEAADPAYGQTVLERLSRSDLKGRVVRHGKLTRLEVADLYQSSDLFVLPSLRETYGTVYGEAMASGLPVVGWKAGNLPHLARHEVEGLVIEPGDLAGLREALQRLASDAPLRERMAAAARARAESFPTWDQTTAGIVESVRRRLS